jgi:tripartite-type tricarboxylate transporter receptor subunit TctC
MIRCSNACVATSMISHPVRRARAWLAAILACALAAPAAAQSADDFYRGRSINMIIGFDVGGGYDIYARLGARYLGYQVSGQPKVVPQNMPGAGGLAAMNYLYKVAAKDGSVIGATHSNIALGQIMGGKNIEYDARGFNWLGRMTSTIDVHYVWHTSQTVTFDDLKTRETVAAGTGPSSNSVIFPKLLNAIAGTKIKLISGFKGTNEANLAMQRGEVEMVDKPWEGVKSENGDWLRDKQIRLIVQYGVNRHHDLPDLPTIVERMQTEEQKQIVRLFVSTSEIGRTMVMPPGVPKERVAALRDGFTKMTKDPALLAEAKKMNLDLDPLSGAELQRLVTSMFELKPDVVAHARAIFPESK